MAEWFEGTDSWNRHAPAAAGADRPLPREVLGRFRLLRVVGRGAFGVVW